MAALTTSNEDDEEDYGAPHTQKPTTEKVVKVPSPKGATAKAIKAFGAVAKGKEDEHQSDDEDPEELDSEEEEEEAKQVVVLRKHARVLERLGDMAQTENVYSRALELNPMDVKTLQGYAVFLHTRRGELARAEAFFLRALHICLPDFVVWLQQRSQNNVDGMAIIHNSDGSVRLTFKPEQEHTAETSGGPAPGPKICLQALRKPSKASLRVHTVARLLFEVCTVCGKRAKEMLIWLLVYRKSIDVDPSNAECLAKFAHFLSQEGDKKSMNEALELYSKALRYNPDNALHILQYARLLKKTKNKGQADLMYQVALEKSKGNKKLEPIAICNYATFTCRVRKNPSLAQKMFSSGLEQFPGHKGLIKNYEILLKEHRDLGSPTLRCARNIRHLVLARARPAVLSQWRTECPCRDLQARCLTRNNYLFYPFGAIYRLT